MSAPEVPLSSLVTDYMPGNLETAITPTPRRAELSDVCVRVGSLAVSAADGELAADVHAELQSLFGSNAVVSGAGVETPNAAHAVLRVGLQPDLNRAIADKGPEAYVLTVAGPAGWTKRTGRRPPRSPASPRLASGTRRSRPT